MHERVNKWKFCIFIIFFISFVYPASSQTAGEWVEKGIAYSKQGEYDKAIESYNKAIAIDPNDKKAWLNKGFAFAELGEHDKAIEAYNKAIAIDPNYKDEWLIGGLVFFELGEYDKAIESYNKAIAIDLNDAAAWAYKGTALIVLGKYDEAIEAYNKATAIDPNYSEAWVNKGTAFAVLGEYDKAIEAYNKAIVIDPNYKDAWYNKGFAFGELGEYDKAIEAYNKAIAIDPNDEGAWLNKGVAFYELGEYNKALEAFDKALEIDPNYKKAKENKDLATKKMAEQTSSTPSGGQENNWIIISGIAIFIIIGIIALRNRKNKRNNDIIKNTNTDYKINKWKILGYTIITWLTIAVIAKIIVGFEPDGPTDLMDVTTGLWSIASLILGIVMTYWLKKKEKFVYGILLFLFIVPIIVSFFGGIGILFIMAYFFRSYEELERYKMAEAKRDHIHV